MFLLCTLVKDYILGIYALPTEQSNLPNATVAKPHSLISRSEKLPITVHETPDVTQIWEDAGSGVMFGIHNNCTSVIITRAGIDYQLIDN